jgi:NADPH:quinone reductase
MKIAQIHEFGPPSVIQIVNSNTPQPSDDELLIKIHAAGVNPIDGKIREGSSFVAQSLKDQLPICLGYDLCGEVVQCGARISQLQPGQRVVGSVGRHLSPSAYSEYVVAKIHEVLPIPDGLDAVTAAALPIAGLTAWQAIHKHGKLQKGERILIHAGAGGVGHLAVQLARIHGAEVWTTASPRHHEFLQKLGMEHIIDYRETDFETVIQDVDLVIDLVGGETGVRSFDVLKAGGRIVTVPTITRDDILEKAAERQITATGMLAEINLSDLSRLVNMVATQEIQLAIGETYPFSDVVLAHESLEKKNTEGKIVLTM